MRHRTHLRFTMQVDGVQVNAAEWWDPHWVKDRILSRMDATLADEKTAGGYPTPTRAAKKKRHR
ncbi:MAG TPA: hypothetical protein VNH18_29025 [Bryobacteraceae bacterium]|nr:hypothetical protein [Bryobacteraceae bacterium]